MFWVVLLFGLCRYLVGSGPIWLDDVNCVTSDRLHILQCSNDGIGVSNCIHEEDIAVECCEFVIMIVHMYIYVCNGNTIHIYMYIYIYIYI